MTYRYHQIGEASAACLKCGLVLTIDGEKFPAGVVLEGIERTTVALIAATMDDVVEHGALPCWP